MTKAGHRELPAEVLARLPATARALVALLGQADAIRVMKACGGRDLYVPSRVASKAAQRLCEAVSAEVAAKLIERHAGRTIYVPAIDGRITTLVRDMVLFDRLHLSNDELTDQFQLCRRTILRKRKQAAARTDKG